jgi:hypothetical protein
LSDSTRGYHEFAEYFPQLNLERAPSRARPSKLPISQRASDLIVYCEVSSETHYTDKLQRPTWPGGNSGITIGIGYDLGYVKPPLFRSDWNGYLGNLDENSLRQLDEACLKTGTKASSLIANLQHIQIPWIKANAQFLQYEQPHYVGLTEDSLPNFAALPPDARGALVSLVYNRGPSFNVPSSKDPSGRYEEMRNIRILMIRKDFAAIPDELRKMTRIWEGKPNMKGVVKRRELEASLFEIGLAGG